MDHGELVNQREKGHPRDHFEAGNDVQRVSGSPRRTGSVVSLQCYAKHIEFVLDMAVVTPHPVQRVKQLIRRVQAHVLMKDCPPDLKDGKLLATIGFTGVSPATGLVEKSTKRRQSSVVLSCRG